VAKSLKAKEIGERLRQFGANKFSHRTEFAHFLGMSYESLTNYINGQALPGNTMQDRLRKLGCDIEWLMTGKLTDEQRKNLRPVYAAVPAGRGKVHDIPSTYEEAPPNVDDEGKGYWLRVKGDSMHPAIRDGQMVFVNPQREVRDNDFAVVSWDEHEEGAIKEVHFREEDIILSSINQLHVPIVIKRKSLSMIARICYVKL